MMFVFAVVGLDRNLEMELAGAIYPERFSAHL